MNGQLLVRRPFGQLLRLTTQRQFKKAWTKPPMMGPMTLPPTEERTTKQTAYCCSSGSHMSATMPRVTEPPALERPPRTRPTMIDPKLGASAQGSWKTDQRVRERSAETGFGTLQARTHR